MKNSCPTGGQSVPAFDFYLAPYVSITFSRMIAELCEDKYDLDEKSYKALRVELLKVHKNSENERTMNSKGEEAYKAIMRLYFSDKGIEFTEEELAKIIRRAYTKTYRRTFQSMEAFIHNLNTMHCLPASERIWVLDTKLNKFGQMTMEELDKAFEVRRFKVISLNQKTGKAEFKFITASQRKDNFRNIVKVMDNQGRTVRVTDNHGLMTVDDNKITEKLPKDCTHTISPRGIDFPPVKYDICISENDTYKKFMHCGNIIDHIVVNKEFARLAGIYLATGKLDCEINTEKLFGFKCDESVECIKEIIAENCLSTELLFADDVVRKQLVRSLSYHDSINNGEEARKLLELRLFLDTSMIEKAYETNPDAPYTENIFINEIVSKEEYNSEEEYVYDISVEDNENFLTAECIYVHNSRAGAQVPFSSINYGTDTSEEGRTVIKSLLLTTEDGLGNGETPIFPQIVGGIAKGNENLVNQQSLGVA